MIRRRRHACPVRGPASLPKSPICAFVRSNHRFENATSDLFMHEPRNAGPRGKRSELLLLVTGLTTVVSLTATATTEQSKQDNKHRHEQSQKGSNHRAQKKPRCTKRPRCAICPGKKMGPIYTHAGPHGTTGLTIVFTAPRPPQPRDRHNCRSSFLTLPIKPIQNKNYRLFFKRVLSTVKSPWLIFGKETLNANTGLNPPSHLATRYAA